MSEELLAMPADLLRRELDEALRSALSEGGTGSGARIAIAVGALVARGAKIPPGARAPELLDAVLRGIADEELTGPAFDVLAELLESLELPLGTPPEEIAARADAVRRALYARDRLELAWLGASTLLGPRAYIPLELEVARAAFDDAVSPLASRLTRWNELRAEGLAGLGARTRARFWWRSQAANVRASALDALPAVAELLAAFPALRAELTAESTLVEGVRALSASSAGEAETSGGRVISMREWLRSGARGAARERIAAAAASANDDERPLLDDADVEIVWVAPASLVLYVIDLPRLRSAPMVAVPGGGSVRAVPSPEDAARFVAALWPEALDAVALHVTLAFEEGVREIEIGA
jgi:hypothetical protein